MFRRALILLILAAFLVVPVAVSASGDEPVEGGTSISDTSQSESDAGAMGPVIFFPEITHDFGEVAQRTTLINTFKVMNNGDAPLELISVKGT